VKPGAEVVVVGAGAFGAWCAWHAQAAGRRTLLLDPFGPGNARSSSGGETRIIRMGYGADALYTHWSLASLEQWKALAARSRRASCRPCLAQLVRSELPRRDRSP